MMKIRSAGRALIMLCTLILVSGMINDLYAQAEVVRVRKVEFEGNEHYSSAFLRSLMENRSKTTIETFMIWKRSPLFEPSLLESDLRRIERNYQRVGYLNVKISEPELTYNVPETRVTIKITINEGIRVRARKIDFIFPDPETELFEEEKLITLRRRLNLKENSHFRDLEFQDDLKMIAEYFDELGYPFIKVDYKLILTDTEEEVDITYLVRPGPKAYFGEIFFNGLEKISEEQLRRLLNVRTGEDYSRRRMEQTRTRLQSLGIFQFVSVNVRLDTISDNVPVEITLRENHTLTLNFGVGYSTELDEIERATDLIQEKRFRYFIEASRLRFLGGLRRGTLLIRRSYLEPIHINARLFQPAVPTIHSNIILNPYYRQEREPGYRIERIGGNTTLNYRVSGRTSTYLTYTFENNKLLRSAEDIAGMLTYDPGRDLAESPSYLFTMPLLDTNEQLSAPAHYLREIPATPTFYRKSSVTWGILRDSSSPVFYPSKGSLLSNSVTLSGLGFGSDFRYLRMIADARIYQGLSPELVLAMRIKGGFIKGLAEGEYIPIEDRFYAGGTYSVRGWRRSDIGPKSSEGQPLGGKSLLEGSVELRYPVWKQISVVGFFDYGNVWADTFDHDPEDLRYAAGGGLRFGTPVGPFRLDIGTPVGEGKNPIQVFISIGQAF